MRIRLILLLLSLVFLLDTNTASAAWKNDGVYAVIQNNRVEGMRFKVRKTNLYGLYLTMISTCSGADGVNPGILAISGSNSQHLYLPRSGRAVGSFETEDGGGRPAWVNYTIKIRGNRATAVIAMVSHGVSDTCEGANTYRLRKAPTRR